MAIAFRDSATTDIAVATASPEVTKPPGTQEGDLLLVFGFTFNPRTFTAPAGWTEIQNEQTTSGGGNLGVLYKVAGASEPSTWTLTDLLSSTDQAAFGALAYSGVDQATPIHTSNAIGDVSSSTTLSGPEITTTLNNCMIVQIIGADLEATGSAVPDDSPVGTERMEFNGGGGTFCFVWAQEYLQSAAGAISLDARSLSESDQWAHFQIALTPAADARGGYRRLVGPTQLPASATDLYTAPAGTRVRVRHLHLSNPSGSPVGVTLSIGADAAATRILDDKTLAAGAVYSTRVKARHTLEAGEKIQGFADTGGVVVAVMDGYLEKA